MLYVEGDNDRARRLYERFGFRSTYERRLRAAAGAGAVTARPMNAAAAAGRRRGARQDRCAVLGVVALGGAIGSLLRYEAGLHLADRTGHASRPPRC